MVALVLTQFVLAAIFEEMEKGPAKGDMIGTHKAVGITVLVLAALRLAWRFTNPVPVLPATTRNYERVLSRIAHTLLYILLVSMPLSGWMMSSAGGRTVSYFGLFDLPNLVAESEAIGDFFHEFHEIAAVIFVAVIALHLLAALKHHFVDKNDVLRRIVPGWYK
jgi:cytochrome b561